MHDQKNGIDLSSLGRLLSTRLGRPTEIVAAEPLASGYHSDGYRLAAADGRAFFLKRTKSRDLGFEFPERQLSSLLVGHGMAARAAASPAPVAVVLASGGAPVALPEITDDAEVWQIQEFADLGESYWTRLLSRTAKERIDDVDERELTEVVRIMADIHSCPLPFADEARKRSVYEDALRAPLANPELTLKLLQDFPDDHPIFPAAEQDAHVARMLAAARRFRGRSERLRTLHGDFWGANLFFDESGTARVVDFSRIPYGDPGIDVGWWFSQYLWFFTDTGNPYFRELGERFLARYEERTGDREIRSAMLPVLGFHAVVYTTPRFFPGLDVATGTRFVATIRRALTDGRFSW